MDLGFAATEADGDWDADSEDAPEEAPLPPGAIVPNDAAHENQFPIPAPPPIEDAPKEEGPAKSKIHTNGRTRYFVIRSNNHKNLVLSIENNVWATQRHNEIKLNEALQTAPHVILIFSVVNSGAFQGYAKMMGPTGKSHKRNVFTGFPGTFDVRWLRLDDLDHSQVASITNPWNENKSVKTSRDGQELPNDIGKRVCEMVDKRVWLGDPTGYAADENEVETGGFGPPLAPPQQEPPPFSAPFALTNSTTSSASSPGAWAPPSRPPDPHHPAAWAYPPPYYPPHPWGRHPGAPPSDYSDYSYSDYSDSEGEDPYRRHGGVPPPIGIAPMSAMPAPAPVPSKPLPTTWEGAAPPQAPPTTWTGAAPGVQAKLEAKASKKKRGEDKDKVAKVAKADAKAKKEGKQKNREKKSKKESTADLHPSDGAKEKKNKERKKVKDSDGKAGGEPKKKVKKEKREKSDKAPAADAPRATLKPAHGREARPDGGDRSRRREPRASDPVERDRRRRRRSDDDGGGAVVLRPRSDAPPSEAAPAAASPPGHWRPPPPRPGSGPPAHWGPPPAYGAPPPLGYPSPYGAPRYPPHYPPHHAPGYPPRPAYGAAPPIGTQGPPAEWQGASPRP